MTKSRLIALIVPLVGMSLLAAQKEDAKGNPLVGTWTANMSKSKQNPNNRLESVTLQIIASGDAITMAATFVDASGQERKAAETFRTDGKETPGKLNPGIVLAATWRGPHILDSVAKKDGKEFARVVYEVSRDGKTLTATSSGIVEQVIVYERQ
jgi:hypothetical protein